MNFIKPFYLFLLLLLVIQLFIPVINHAQSDDSIKNITVLPADSKPERIIQLDDNLSENKIKAEFSIDSLLKYINLEKILWIFGILLVGYYIIKLITKLLLFISGKTTRFRKQLNGSVAVIYLLGWGSILYVILVLIIQLPDGLTVAITAAICIAVGLAARDILKNVFGGITILFEHTFQKGDKIRIREHYGEVIKMGLRSTRIKTDDDSVVSIPNSEILNNAVYNSNSGEPNCHVVAEIYLPVDINTTRAREIAIEAAKVSRYIYLNKPITVIFINEVKGRKSYLNMRLKAYVMDLEYESALKSEMTEIVIRELLREGLISKDKTV